MVGLMMGGAGAEEEEDKPLPSLRQDLEFLKGPVGFDGGPTYTICDPLSRRYFHVSWKEWAIWQCLKPGMNKAELLEVVHKKTTVRINDQDIKAFFESAENNHLMQKHFSSDELNERHQKTQQSWFKWLIFHYLFFKVPFFKPDRFLEKAMPYAKILISRPAWYCYLFFSISGFVLLIQNIEQFINTFLYFFTWEGFIIYSFAISAVKIIHEFAHGFTAKYYGLRVPSIGAAFILFWPVLYTDITDSWQLPSRLQRIKIEAAGIIVELVIAGLSTFGWVYTSPGMLHSVFFVLASTSWISTLVVNLNPAMRFDGYYLFSDFWGIDNMHSRAFTVAKTFIRKYIIGLPVSIPEDLPRKHLIGLGAFAVFTWLWRLTAYTAIAVVVYYKFTKSLGIIMFLLEIIVLLLNPIVSELQAIWKLRTMFSMNKNFVASATVLSLFVLWFTLPLPRQLVLTGISVAGTSQAIWVPSPGKVQNIYVKRGQKVQVGDKIMDVSSKDLSHRIEQAKFDAEILAQKIDTITANDEQHHYLAEKQAELARTQAEVEGLEKLENQSSIKAEVSGTVHEWDNSLRKGLFLPKNAVVGKIADLKHVEVSCYVPESLFSEVELGKPVSFWFKRDTWESVDGKIISVVPLRSTSLEYEQLASHAGGNIAVVPKRDTGDLLMVDSYYPVKIELESYSEDLPFGQTGEIYLYSSPKSHLMSFMRSVIRIFWKESSF